MRIEDYESKHDVTDPRDIRAVLSKRYDDRNTFWLFHGDEEFPEMNILANGELAYVHFFPREGHPGLASVGALPNLRPGEDMVFLLYNSREPIEVMNESVIAFSDALKAAQEFAISKSLPKCIRWRSLVRGE
jgi:hypothetical protein